MKAILLSITKSLSCTLLFTLACWLAPPLTGLGWVQQDPPVSVNLAQQLQQQRLQSLDGLSDEEVRQIYLNEPWRLPNQLSAADQATLDRVIRSMHTVRGGSSGS